MASAPRVRCLLAVVGCGLALHATQDTPGAALTDVRAALVTGGGTDPFAALVPVVALLAWLLTAWLAATVLLTVAGELPGAIGRVAGAAAACVAPAAVRRVVQVALGLGLAAGVTCASPAAAAPLAEGPGTSAGTTAVTTTVPSLDWPSETRPAPPPPAPPPATAAGEVVVAPGDSLWTLAERALGPSATPAQVAATWPAWWAANRDVVGADPHVIHPGDRLTPPPSSS